MKKNLIAVFSAVIMALGFSSTALAGKGDTYGQERAAAHRAQQAQTPARASGKISPQEVARRNAAVCKDGSRCPLEAAAAESTETGTRQASNNPCAGLSGNALTMCKGAASALPAMGGLLGR